MCICTLDTCSTHCHALLYYLGDFHFLWECLKVIFQIFWGSPSQKGSLQSERDHTACSGQQSSKSIVADEFMVHVFKAHLSASVCTLLKLPSTSEVIHHQATERRLRETAETLLADTIMPVQASDWFILFIDHSCTWGSCTMILGMQYAGRMAHSPALGFLVASLFSNRE